MNVSFKIKIFDSQGTRVVQLAKSTLTIGGAPHCDVVINHPSVSPEHTRAWLEGGRIWVQDLGAESGTALNDIRLPALKPMLVRDLDILRLGQGEATLGLEAVLVRAPVVKGKVVTASPADQPPKLDGKSAARALEVEQRREQVEALSRQLAELRLQLQMAKLEKGSDEELAQQMQNLRDEIKGVQEQKAKWNDTFRQMEAEKEQMRKNVEAELLEFKSRTAAELKSKRENDQKKMDGWKQEAVRDLSQALHGISLQKVRSWATRPLSQDMLFEWEGDLTHLFRRVLLGDSSPPPVYKAPAPVVSTMTIDLSEESHPSSNSGTGARIATDETVVHKIRPRPANKKRAGGGKIRIRRQITLTSIVVALLVTGILLGTAYYHQHGTRSLSSQGESIGHPNPVQSQRFQPKQSHKFRGSYTENVLYLENYVAAEENADFHRRWTTELSKAATQDWKLNPATAGSVLSKERILIQDLSQLRERITVGAQDEGINQMRSREALFLKDLEATLKNRASVERFLSFKRKFYTRNQAYLSVSNSP